MKKQHGFSLIEVLIVICIIGIMAGVAIPFLGGFIDNRNLKTAARDIAGDIFEYKEKAVAENRMYQIVFGTSDYSIRQCNDNSNPCGANNYSELIKKSPAAFGKDITMAENFPQDAIVFQTRGTVSLGTVNLGNNQGSTATIVTTITGRPYVDWTIR